MICILLGILLGMLAFKHLKRNFPGISIVACTCLISLGTGLGLFMPTNYQNADLLSSQKLYPVSVQNNEIFVIESNNVYSIKVHSSNNLPDTVMLDKKSTEIFFVDDVESTYYTYLQYSSPSVWSFSLIKVPRFRYEIYISRSNFIKG